MILITHFDRDLKDFGPGIRELVPVFDRVGKAGCQHFGMVPLELARVVDVHFRDEETVDRRARVDIANRERVFVLGDLLDGDFSPVHPAEKAILLHAPSVDSLRVSVDSPAPLPRKSYGRFTVRR